MKELISKASDGNFVLTSAGEQELYFITTRKLIQYYLREVLNKDSNAIAEQMNSLTIFIFNNFKKVDDYLKKLPDLANFIQETNLEKFQKFMGKYFISTLQKEKQILIKRESEHAKEKLDNPFWAPSNEMLKTLESEFLKAPALKFPGNGMVMETGKEGLQNPSNGDKKIRETMNQENQGIGSEPGVELLKLFEKSFVTAKPLDTKSFQSSDLIGTLNNNTNNNDPGIYKEASRIQEKADLDPPGVHLISTIGSLFTKCPPLEITFNTVIDESRDKIPVDSNIISIKAFATLLSNISKFSKTKDKAGYQNWYNNLNPKLKAAVKINSLHNSEKKGEIVNWGQEIMVYAASTNENKDELYQLTEEVKLYIKVLNFIRHRLTNDPKIKLTPQEASSIYNQSINILAGIESPAEKKSAITILLFQITDQAMREVLLKDFEKILSALG